MRTLFLIAVLALSLGCTQVQSSSGARLRATGDSLATLTTGKLVLKTDTATGELVPVSCEPWTDSDGDEHPCEHLVARGGKFTGWETFFSVAGLVANVWGAAK